MVADLKIQQKTQLTSREHQRLFRWSANIFSTTDPNLTYRLKDGVIRFVLYHSTEGPVSHTAVLKHPAIANDSVVLIGGIGGVVTIPEAQGRGYATVLVRHATEFLRDQWHVDFALLFCIDRMVGYYERLGWRKVSCEVLIDQPAGKIRCPFHVMTCAFNDQFETIETLDLGSAPW
jgi:GNAT superfamily N-acetyltransferase